MSRSTVCAAHLDVLAEELRPRERAVDDVEVHGGGEEEDEERREREVGDERPARRGLAEDLLDVGDEGSHDGFLRSVLAVAGLHEVDEDVLERGADRRQLGDERAAGTRPRRRARSGARRRAPSARTWPLTPLGARTRRAEAPRGAPRRRPRRDESVASKHRLRSVPVVSSSIRPSRRELPLPEDRHAVARQLDLREEVGVEEDRAPRAQPPRGGGRGSRAARPGRRRPSARRGGGRPGRGRARRRGRAAASSPSRTASPSRRPSRRAGPARGARGSACASVRGPRPTSGRRPRASGGPSGSRGSGAPRAGSRRGAGSRGRRPGGRGAAPRPPSGGSGRGGS